MVTAESGVEYVYAVEETQNVNRTNSYNGDEVARETQQENTEQKYIVVDAGNGKKEAARQNRTAARHPGGRYRV